MNCSYHEKRFEKPDLLFSFFFPILPRLCGMCLPLVRRNTRTRRYKGHHKDYQRACEENSWGKGNPLDGVLRTVLREVDDQLRYSGIGESQTAKNPKGLYFRLRFMDHPYIGRMSLKLAQKYKPRNEIEGNQGNSCSEEDWR